MPNISGASHADDLQYLFLTSLTPFDTPKPIKAGTEDDNIMESFTTLLTDFAKTGTPRTGWPVADSQQYPYLEIGSEVRVQKGFCVDEVKFWDTIYQDLKN